MNSISMREYPQRKKIACNSKVVQTNEEFHASRIKCSFIYFNMTQYFQTVLCVFIFLLNTYYFLHHTVISATLPDDGMNTFAQSPSSTWRNSESYPPWFINTNCFIHHSNFPEPHTTENSRCSFYISGTQYFSPSNIYRK